MRYPVARPSTRGIVLSAIGVAGEFHMRSRVFRAELLTRDYDGGHKGDRRGTHGLRGITARNQLWTDVCGGGLRTDAGSCGRVGRVGCRTEFHRGVLRVDHPRYDDRVLARSVGRSN